MSSHPWRRAMVSSSAPGPEAAYLSGLLSDLEYAEIRLSSDRLATRQAGVLNGAEMAAIPTGYRPLPCPLCKSQVTVTWEDAGSHPDDGPKWIPINPQCTNYSCTLSSLDLDGHEKALLARSIANWYE